MRTFVLLTEDIKYLDEARSQSAGEVSGWAAQECRCASDMSAAFVCLCVCGRREEAWGADKDTAQGKYN